MRLGLGLGLNRIALGGGSVVSPTASAVTAGTQESDGDVPIYVADLNSGSTAYWVLVPNGSTAPNQAEVLAGQASGGGAPTDAGSFSATPSGGPYEEDVTAGLDGSFDLYVVFQNAAGASPVYSDTAISIDSTAPVASITGVTAGSTQLSVDWTTDTGAGTARIVVVPNGATAPTATEILAGQASGGGSPSSDSGNITVSGTGAQTTVVLTGLTNGVAYDVYLAHADEFSNAVTDSDLNNSPVGVSAVVFDPSHKTMLGIGDSFTARTGSNRLLVASITFRSDSVGVTHTNNPAKFTLSLGGTDFTTVSELGVRYFVSCAQCYLKDADIPAGANTISVSTLDGYVFEEIYIEITEMTGVDQTSPVNLGATDKDNTATTSFSTTGTTSANNSLILSIAGLDDPAGTDVLTGATTLTDDTSGSLVRHFSGYEEVATSGTGWAHNHSNASAAAYAYSSIEVVAA